MPKAAAAELLKACCGSSKWVTAMLTRRPFGSRDVLLAVADLFWQSLGKADWLEAFSRHPRIGERSQGWSAAEQAGMNAAGEAARTALAKANLQYEARFGYVFILCATGKTAEEMLDLARTRLNNPPDVELTIAAREQQKIMHLRLEKLLR